MNEDFKTVSIKNPCTKENWDLMTETEQGKFCSSCKKKVYDFTNWETSDIIQFVEKSPVKICGKFNKSQISELNKQDIFKFNHWKPLAASFLMLAFIPFYAKTSAILDKILPSEKLFNLNPTYFFEIKDFQETGRKISGRLIDQSSKKPIPGTKISIHGTNLFTSTNRHGYFEIQIPTSYKFKEIILIVEAAYGFEGQTKAKVFTKDLPINKLLIQKPDVLVGEISVSESNAE